MTTCHVCTARSNGANLCRKHARALEKSLAEMPWLIEQLDVTITRQDRGTDAPLYAPHRERIDRGYEEGTITLPCTPWPLAWDAADLRWRIDNTLSTWLRHLVESRGVPVAALRLDEFERLVDAVPLARILLRLLNTITQDEAAGAIYEEILSCERDARRAIDRQGPDVFLGRCDALVLDLVGAADIVPIAEVCGTDLMAHAGDDEVRCRSCGAVFDVALLKRRLPELDDAWARPHVIAGALSTIDDDLPASTLRTWIERDAKLGDVPPHRQPERPLVLQVGIDDDGKPLYRVGDVRARLAWSKTRDELRRHASGTGKVADRAS